MARTGVGKIQGPRPFLSRTQPEAKAKLCSNQYRLSIRWRRVLPRHLMKNTKSVDDDDDRLTDTDADFSTTRIKILSETPLRRGAHNAELAFFMCLAHSHASQRGRTYRKAVHRSCLPCKELEPGEEPQHVRAGHARDTGRQPETGGHWHRHVGDSLLPTTEFGRVCIILCALWRWNMEERGSLDLCMRVYAIQYIFLFPGPG